MHYLQIDCHAEVISVNQWSHRCEMVNCLYFNYVQGWIVKKGLKQCRLMWVWGCMVRRLSLLLWADVGQPDQLLSVCSVSLQQQQCSWRLQQDSAQPATSKPGKSLQLNLYIILQQLVIHILISVLQCVCTIIRLVWGLGR